MDRDKRRISRNSIIAPADVEASAWSDFIDNRKARRSSVSETALKGIRQEAEKAGISFQQSIEIMLARGWQGFNAKLLTEKDNGTGQSENRAIVNGNGSHAGEGTWTK